MAISPPSTSTSSATTTRSLGRRHARHDAGRAPPTQTAVRSNAVGLRGEPLAPTTARNFEIRDVTGDKAYLSHANLAAIEAVGGKPFIPFKSNSTDYGSPAWARLFHLFALHRPEFLVEHYHRRSNAEATFSALKRKFGGSVRGKKPVVQANEVLCKIICYNLAVLVHAMFELGLKPAFAKTG